MLRRKHEVGSARCIEFRASVFAMRQILEAATLRNAKFLHRDDTLETIQVGKRANLVLLGRSPLDTVEAYDSVLGVWIGGHHLLPSDLEAQH